MESESCQSDITFVDPTKRIVKYFAKCLIELAKHAESIQYKNNKIVNYDVSSQSKVDEGSGCELDITEHNIKSEIQIEEKNVDQINKLKKCIVELLTLCSQQNILIDYDTTRPNITEYDTFDDAQRILIMNHLTLNVVSILENIFISIELLKSFNYMENGQHIRKSFSTIYKEIKSLPMRPDITENMDSSFKSLTNKNDYTDAYNYLAEQLTILCKYTNKFNRIYHRKCGYNDILTSEDSTSIFSDESPKKSNIKPRRKKNLHRQETQDSLFKTPESIQPINTDTGRYKTVNPGERTKKENRANLQNKNLDNITTEESHIKNKETGIHEIQDFETKKRRKHKSITNTENILDKTENYKSVVESLHANIEDNIIRKKSETEKKNQNQDEREFHVDKIIKSVATNTNVNQINVEKPNPNIENVIIENKSKSKSKNKIKDIINKESNENQDVEKLITERELHIIEAMNSVATNTNVNEIIGEKTNLNIENDMIGNKTKTKKKKSKKRKFNEDTEKKHNDNSDQLESQQENDVQVHKKRKQKKLRKEERNLNKKNTSATNHPEIHCENYTQDLNTYLNKFNNPDNEFMNYFEDNDSADDTINELLCESNTLPSEILSAIANGDIEIDYDNQDTENFTKIITQNNLNENERYLYIQDLLEAAKDKVALSDQVKEKLRGLSILVDWEVPPAHEICAKLTSGPSEKEKMELEALGVTTQKHFSKKETDIIRRNWKLFCEKHDLEDDPVPFLLLPTFNNRGLLDYSERKKFIQFLGQGLPNKALHSIYRRFRIIFTPAIKKGRFTPEEDQLILTYMSRLRQEDTTKKFSRLSPILNRSRAQIERRYRYLRYAAEQSTKKISWNLELQETFLKHLLEETHSNDVEDLRDKNIDISVFIVIGKKMDMPSLKLKQHWLARLHTQLFATEPIVKDFINLKLIKIFRKLKFDDWKTVDWNKIVARFYGFTQRHLWTIMKNLEKFFVPQQHKQNLKACIEYLHTHHVPKLKQKPTFGNRIMPRLQYEDGILTKYV